MLDSSNPPIQDRTYPTNNADLDEDKIASYMWYIHVTVRVNAPERLRYSLANILGQGMTTETPASPPYPVSSGFGNPSRGSRMLDNEIYGASAADKIDDLTDYLVLQSFSLAMLEILINTAPIEAHAEGYEQALAGIPAHFREEFCRRLYCLLFSKYIVEWPSNIAVPEPAPGSIAAAAAAAAASSSGSEDDEASTGSETAVSERERNTVYTPVEEDDDNNVECMSVTDQVLANMDGISIEDDDDDIFIDVYNNALDSEKYEYLDDPEPESPGRQSTLGPSSPWPDMSSPGYNPELARAAYFGTVSAPMPIQYREAWGRSSRSDGIARAAYAEAEARAGLEVGEYAYATADADACAGEEKGGASHDDEGLPPPSSPRRHHLQPAPPHATRPASQLGSAHSRVSHTGSICWPCRAREAWSHGVGAQR